MASTGTRGPKPFRAARQFREDLIEIRRARRATRARLNAKWDEKGVWRPSAWARLIVWGGAVLGMYLLVGGDTVERVIGVGLVAVPSVLAGISFWVYWKALRILRGGRASRAGTE